MSEKTSPLAIDISSLGEIELQQLAESAQRQLETLRKSKRVIPPKDKGLEEVVAAISKVAETHDAFPRSVIIAICNQFDVDISVSNSISESEFSAAKAGQEALTYQNEMPPASTAPAKKEESSSETAAESATTKQKAPRRIKGRVGLSKPARKPRKPAKPTPTTTTKKSEPTIASKSSRLSPKYTHPDNSEMTWSGAGKKPRWVIACLESGMSMSDLLTNK